MSCTLSEDANFNHISSRDGNAVIYSSSTLNEWSDDRGMTWSPVSLPMKVNKLVIGQSNASLTGNQAYTANPNVRLLDTVTGAFVTYDPDGWSGVTNQAFDTANFGIAGRKPYSFYASLEMASAYPGVLIETIQSVKNGQPISYWQNGNNGYEAILAQFAQSGWDKATVVELCQGEANAGNTSGGYDDRANWLSGLQDLRSRLIADGVIMESTPWVVCTIPTTLNQNINNDLLAESFDWLIVNDIRTQPLRADNLHYDINVYDDIGKQAHDVLKAELDISSDGSRITPFCYSETLNPNRFYRTIN